MFPWVYGKFLFVPVYQEQANFHDVATHLGVHGYCLFDFCGKRATEMGEMRFFYHQRNEVRPSINQKTSTFGTLTKDAHI
jgi:hypothetical protein